MIRISPQCRATMSNGWQIKCREYERDKNVIQRILSYRTLIKFVDPLQNDTTCTPGRVNRPMFVSIWIDERCDNVTN